jgi:hypothetical protein
MRRPPPFDGCRLLIFNVKFFMERIAAAHVASAVTTAGSRSSGVYKSGVYKSGVYKSGVYERSQASPHSARGSACGRSARSCSATSVPAAGVYKSGFYRSGVYRSGVYKSAFTSLARRWPSTTMCCEEKRQRLDIVADAESVEGFEGSGPLSRVLVLSDAVAARAWCRGIGQKAELRVG